MFNIRWQHSLLLFALLVSLGGCRGTEQITIPTTPPTPSLTNTPTIIPSPTPVVVSLELQADQLALAGDHLTAGLIPKDCQFFSPDIPTGGILLGAGLQCNPTTWAGGTATTEIVVPALQFPAVVVVEVSGFNVSENGLRAFAPNQTARIYLDDEVIWEKRAAYFDAGSNSYYAIGGETITTTFVVQKAETHTLEIEVPPGMVWGINDLKATSQPFPDHTLGVGYSPYRDCQYPDGDIQPTSKQVESDLMRLAHLSTAIRTYSSTGINGEVPAMANRLGIPVYIGAWLDVGTGTENDPLNQVDLAADDVEIGDLVRLAQTTHVEAIIIGNEYYLRHTSQEGIDYLLQRIRQVKGQLPSTPIATAEIDSHVFTWGGSASMTPQINPIYRPILDELDILLVHIYPFWAGRPVHGAAEYTIERYKVIQELLQVEYPDENKRVIIGEAGWPSYGLPDFGNYGGDYGGSSAENSTVYHPEEQRQYMIELLTLAQQEGVDLFYFDAFDELWKEEGIGGAGQSWGFSYSDRTAKYDLYGLLVPIELLPDPESTSMYFEPYPSSPYVGETTVFSLYSEWPADLIWQPEEELYFAPAIMGYLQDLHIDQCSRMLPHSGRMATRIAYTPTDSSGWAGIYWLYPDQNWGELPGMDLKSANALVFWARGEQGGEVVEFFTGGICSSGDSPVCPDTIQPDLSTGNIVLSSEWTRYLIDLRDKDLSGVVGGLGFAVAGKFSPEGEAFYIDDVSYENLSEFPPDVLIYPTPPGPVFTIYADYAAPENHYLPSNFMGDGETLGHVVIDQVQVDPYNRETSIRFSYTQGSQGWAGVYWTDPEDNWGQRPGGYDLTGADRIVFWARAENPTTITFLVGGIGYREGIYCSNPEKPYPDSICPVIKTQVSLTTEWERYEIDLSNRNPDLSQVLGAFGWVSDRSVTFYLDRIVYEFDE